MTRSSEQRILNTFFLNTTFEDEKGGYKMCFLIVEGTAKLRLLESMFCFKERVPKCFKLFFQGYKRRIMMLQI